MKKIGAYLILLVIVISCTSDDRYESYNKDPKRPTIVEADLLFNSATKTLVERMTTPNINVNIFRLMAQQWATTTYPNESNYFLTGRTIPQNFWSGMYQNVLLDLTSAQEIVSKDDNLRSDKKTTQVAQAEILMIYAWQILVDTFGDIPYSEGLKATEFPLPKYDDAASIYVDLITRLDVAIANLNGAGFETDNLYFGDIGLWRKFATSLKLRLGIRLIDANSSLAQNVVESAYNLGVFDSNADNVQFKFLGISNPNPIWRDVVQSGRQDFVAANTMVDLMNDLNDPRLAVFFEDNLGAETYVGGIYGAINTYVNFSHLGTLILEPTYPACLIDYAEVSFNLAQAAQLGFAVGGSAEDYYNQGITASFEYWGVTNISDYLANPDVAWATAQGDWREKIGKQFWLAMYNRGFEGWTVWRQMDSPTLNPPELTERPVPTRYTYPVNEQNLNVQNWSAASAAIGGDSQTTKLFWDTQ